MEYIRQVQEIVSLEEPPRRYHKSLEDFNEFKVVPHDVFHHWWSCCRLQRTADRSCLSLATFYGKAENWKNFHEVNCVFHTERIHSELKERKETTSSSKQIVKNNETCLGWSTRVAQELHSCTLGTALELHLALPVGQFPWHKSRRHRSDCVLPQGKTIKTSNDVERSTREKRLDSLPASISDLACSWNNMSISYDSSDSYHISHTGQ